MNGGGQIRDENKNNVNKELLSRVEKVYNSPKIKLPTENEYLERLYGTEWLNENDSLIKTHLHTQYHEIEKLNIGLAVKW